jgi:hypothetical protein
MPIVREAIMSYVQLWNTHSIRKQKDRPNAITGKPAVLYNYTPIVRYGQPIDESLVNELQADFGNWGKYYFFILIFTNLVIVQYITNGIIDIDAYLPPETLKWCRDRLLESGVNLEEVQGSTTSIDGSRIHHQVYLTLRPLVRQHIFDGNQSNLGLCPKVIGGYAQAQDGFSALHRVIHANKVAADTVRQSGEGQQVILADIDHIDQAVDDGWDEENATE